MTWTATALASVSAVCGVMTLIFDKRKDNLEETLKKTRPELNVSIKTGQNNQNLYVVIDPINEVPFQYNIKNSNARKHNSFWNNVGLGQNLP